MFNPLTTDQLIAAMGGKLQDAGRGDGSLSPFEREQLLSAYSLSRHLRGELRAVGAFAEFSERTAGLLAESAETADAATAASLRAAAAEVASGEVPRAGEAIAGLLHELRGTEPLLVEQLHRALRDLVTAEVATLSEALKPGTS